MQSQYRALHYSSSGGKNNRTYRPKAELMAMLVTGEGGSLSIHATKQHSSGWYPDDHFLPPVFTANEL